MTQSIFKFPTLTAARFVVERLQQQGVSAKYLNSSFIQVQGEITDQTEAIVTKELGKKVSSPSKGKTPPPSSEKKKSAPIAAKPAAAPETKAQMCMQWHMKLLNEWWKKVHKSFQNFQK